jgi:hypothetical protein
MEMCRVRICSTFGQRFTHRSEQKFNGLFFKSNRFGAPSAVRSLNECVPYEVHFNNCRELRFIF